MENKNKELETVNKLIKYARSFEKEKQTPFLIISNHNLYIHIRAVENENWSEEEIEILQNVIKIVSVQIREWIIPSEDYIARKFMKIDECNYDSNYSELLDRLEISHNEDHHIDYIVEQTKFPCSVLNYL
ncbi:hypothetical protein ALC152_22300 [Arcobacter sp. 15-2]|uniref:hypothetical protein n=1 Tax=Arcobacter sp. 15-2 TaxID=3374109 RepID=UPI00399D5366